MLRRLSSFAIALLLIEFLDEFVYGVRQAAWPLLRDHLGLTYMQIGLLLGLPNILAGFIEPVLGVLGDTWRRRALVLGGGLFFALASYITSRATSFFPFFIAAVIFSPASGAFVHLAQAALMDHAKDRREQNMARWTFVGSVGVVGGPLVLGLVVWLGWGWRGLYLSFTVLTLFLLLFVRRFPFPVAQPAPEGLLGRTLMNGFRGALLALRRKEVLRWLTLLEFSDLMLDILFGFLALYMVDVLHVTTEQATIAVLVWTGVGLVGDLLLIPLLERVRGLTYLRISAVLELILFPAFLLAPGYILKLVILALLGLFNSGWYSILKGQLYNTMPGQSGAVMTVGTMFGIWGQLLPMGIGLAAQALGLGPAMWLMLAGPVVLLIGLPRKAELYALKQDDIQPPA